MLYTEHRTIARRVAALLISLLVLVGGTLVVITGSAAAALACSRTRNIPDQNGYLDFWHGTSSANATAIRTNGIDPSRGNPNTDFGAGFYVTTLKNQAQDWARKQYPDANPTIMHFRIPYTALDQPTLCGLVFPSATTDWQNFVRKMRTEQPPLGGDGYDFVEGPLLRRPTEFLAGNPPESGGQQNSIHTAAAARIFDAGWVSSELVPPANAMVVGDSISQGSSGDFTWRYRLYQHERANSGVFDLVGPRTDLFNNVTNTWDGNRTYANPNFNQRHDAIWGRTLMNAAANIQDEVAAAKPDYLLVLLGINDMSWGYSDAAGTEESLKRFIGNARAANPYIRMVFGTLLPNTRMQSDSAYASMIADYNRRLALNVTALNRNESPLTLARTHTDIVPTADLWDGIHPNARGEVKIAAAFADALATGFGDPTHGPGIGTSYPRPYPSVPIGPQTAPVLSATAGDGQAALSWTTSPGATGYYVYQRNVTAGESGFTKLPYPVPGSSWTASLLANGSTYQYQLGPTKGNAESTVRSNIVTVTPRGVVPAATTLTVQAANAAADLTWTAVPHTTGFYVFVRNVTAGETTFTQLPYPVSGTSWTAAGLVPGAQYQFQLQSVNGTVLGGRSNIASVTIGGADPAATRLTGTPGNGSITLTWTAVPNASGFYIYQRNITGDETTYTQLPYPVSGTSWTATGLVPGAQYAYRLQSLNGAIRGGTSNAVTVTVGGATPGAPTLSVSPGNGSATLSWPAVANASGYFVYKRDITAGETGYTQLPYPVTGTSWTASGLIAGGQYAFRVQSLNGLIRGGTSNAATVTASGTVPAGPTGLRAAAGNSRAALTWNAAANATGYFVYVRDVTAGESTFRQLPFAVDGEAWEAGMLVNGHQYQFKLQSLNQLLRGGYSNTVSVTPVAPGPPPVPPTTRTIAVSTGWFNTQLGPIQRYDITGSIVASRSGSSMTISQHWDSSGKHINDALFRFQLWDCSTSPDGNPLHGTFVWGNDFAYEDNPSVTSGNATATVTINPTHYYTVRVVGSGNYQWQGILQATFAPYTPPSTPPLIPFDRRTPCF